MENNTIIPLGIQVPEPSDLAPFAGEGIDLPTFGGRMSVRWDPTARVTSVAGLAHFSTFLANTGLFDRLAEDAPFDYKSNNACAKRDILGTAVLAILLGKTRYVHINELRHDTAARELLALDEIVSEDTVRRAFRDADEEKLEAWLSKHEREVFEALSSDAHALLSGWTYAPANSAPPFANPRSLFAGVDSDPIGPGRFKKRLNPTSSSEAGRMRIVRNHAASKINPVNPVETTPHLCLSAWDSTAEFRFKDGTSMFASFGG